MLKSKYILSLYVGCWAFYNIQYLFGLEGSLLTRVLILILNVVSLFYCFAAHVFKTTPLYIKALDAFLIMMTIYGIIYLYSEPVALYMDQVSGNYNYLKKIYNSLLPIYFFYYYTRIGVLNENNIKKLVCFFLFLALLEYMANEYSCIKAIESMNFDVDKSEIVNNMGYGFLALFPSMVLFNKNRTLQYVALMYIMVFVLLGLKRGAILISFICLLFFLWKNLRNQTRLRTIGTIVMSLVVIISVVFLIQYLIENNVFFYARVNDTLNGNSSGRDYLYETCIDHFLYHTNDIQLFFGSGAMATLYVTRVNYAHNDWLELAVNQGLLGVFVYLFYWIAFVRLILHVKNNEIKFILELIFIICFLQTFFSMSYSSMNIYSTSMLGYCLGRSYMPSNMKHSDELLYLNDQNSLSY